MRGGQGSGPAPGLRAGAAGVCRADPALGNGVVWGERQGCNSLGFLTLPPPEGGGERQS